MFSTSNALTEEKSIKYHEQPGNTISQKWNDSSPETKLKVMEDYDLNDREFKIAVVKKLKKIQENSGSSLSSGI